MNNDGINDVIVGAPKADVINPITLKKMRDAGTATIYSGANWSVIHQFNGAAASDNLGAAVTKAFDVNADGYDDVIVGAYLADAPIIGTTRTKRDAGKIFVYSGLNFSELYSQYGSLTGDNFGAALM